MNSCLINQRDCGRVAGDPVCPKCGMDERVVYPGQADREAAQAAARERYAAVSSNACVNERSSPDLQQSDQGAPVTIPMRADKGGFPFVVGETHEGIVANILDFGAMVRLVDGVDGFLHISEMAQVQPSSVAKLLRVGQLVHVKVIGIDGSGRARLSMKFDLQAPSASSGEKKMGLNMWSVAALLAAAASVVVYAFDGFSSASVAPMQLEPSRAADDVDKTRDTVQSAAGSVFDQRYEVLGKGDEVKDLKTGLVWARCSVGQRWDGETCAGDATLLTLQGAQRQARAGWRVPTARELHSLVLCTSGTTSNVDDLKDGGVPVSNRCDGSYKRPAIHSQAFPRTSPDNWYWTSSTIVGLSAGAWFVFFGNGDVDFSGISDGDLSAQRLVRSNL